MNPRRAALLARFRARSLDRTRRLSLALRELESGRGDASAVQEVARDLHTLKGDSTVVGMERLSRAAHAAEGRLLADEGGPQPATCVRVREALEVLDRVLSEQLAGDEAEEVLERLAQELAPAAAPGLAPAEPVPERAVEKKAPVPPEAETRWMQVSVGRVDDLCERVSDLAADFRSLAHLLAPQLESARARAASELLDRCRTRLEDVIAGAWTMRLVPVEPALEALVHHAHQLADAQGKKLRVTVAAHGAEVERSVLDELWEPLVHLVRNAVDHGVEAPGHRGSKGEVATILLEAHSLGPNLVVAVNDDGAGVDLAAIRDVAVERGIFGAEAAAVATDRQLLDLLFLHGFSTRRVADQTSGRGVGLDVVRKRIDALGGTVSLATGPATGTRFELTVPATITRERALVVPCGRMLCAIPSIAVRAVVRLEPSRVQQVAGGRALAFGEEALPLRSLSSALGAGEDGAEEWGVVVESGDRRWAFAASALLGEHELLRRPVDALLSPLGWVSGSAILDDGRLVLIASVAGLVRREQGHAGKGAGQVPSAKARPRVLVVEDSLNVRDLLAELLSEDGIEVRQAGDGQEALEALQREQPDLVLSDVEMPRMDGLELLKAIRSRWQHLPVIMLTTRGSAEDRRKATALGADAYLIKSEFEEGSLLRTIHRFLGGGS